MINATAPMGSRGAVAELANRNKSAIGTLVGITVLASLKGVREMWIAHQSMRTAPAKNLMQIPFQRGQDNADDPYVSCLSVVCYRSKERLIGDGHCLIVSQRLPVLQQGSVVKKCEFREEHPSDILIESGPENFRFSSDIGLYEQVQFGSVIQISGWHNHERPSDAIYKASISEPITVDQHQFVMDKVNEIEERHGGSAWGLLSLNCVEGAILIWESVTNKTVISFPEWTYGLFPPTPSDYIALFGGEQQSYF